jgi:hypothetical protein
VGTASPLAPRVNAAGFCIHAFAATTRIPETRPLSATGMPTSRCCFAVNRSQPYRYSPTKIASRKKAYPSTTKAGPMAGPASHMSFGHRSPSSNDSAVPETAPMANRSAVALPQVRASSRKCSPCPRTKRTSASTMSSGMPMPSAANTMWNASESSICARAKMRVVSCMPRS